MLTLRITSRISNYHKVGIGYLQKHILRFHKISKDGSAKADAFFTGDSNDLVWGVIGLITDESKSTLDEFEGLGKGYNEKEVEIVTSNNCVRCNIYVADPEYIDPNLLPYDWYREFAVQGCIEHQFPDEYIEALRAFPYQKDENVSRRDKNYQIIENAIN